MDESATFALRSQNRRSRHRHKLRTLSHIKLDSSSGGILRDISERGAALQVLSRLPLDQVIHLQFDLANPRLRFEVEARVVWSDSLGQAGLVFVNLGSRSQRVLKEWLLTQILSDAHRIVGDHATELLFSPPSLPAIHLQPDLSSKLNSLGSASVHLLWFDVPALRFSRLVDATALLCSVLLFNLLVLFFTDMVPSWRLAVALIVCVTAAFTAMYWIVFAFWFGVTPGTRLAELACAEAAKLAPAEREIIRFR
jgi:PilZ domain